MTDRSKDDAPLDPEDREAMARLTPGARIDMVWGLTKAEWEKTGWRDTGMRRDIARVIRRPKS